MPSLYETTPESGTVSSTNLTSLYSNTTNFTSGVVNSSVYSVNGGTGVTVDPTTGNVLVSIGQDVATTANPVFAGATLGNVTVGVADNQTITTTSDRLVLESASGEIDTGTTNILSTNSSSFLLLNFPTSVVAFNGATSLQMGANGGLTNINGTLEVDQGIITNNISIAVTDNQTITTSSGDLNLTAINPNAVNISSGTTEPTRITRNSSSTNIGVRSLALSVQSTGTPAVGFGNSLEYEIETAVGNTERAGYVAVISEDLTPGSEDFRMIFGLMTAGAVADTKMALSNTGDLTLDGGIRVLGSTSGSSIFEAPATGSVLSYVLPGTAGSANTVLTNDGSGNLTWALPAGGGSTFGNITVAVVDDNTISTTTGNLVLTADGSDGVEIESGTTAPTLITRNSTATTSSIRSLALAVQSSGTPTVGFGNNLEWQLETAPGNTESAGFISVVSTDLTAASEDFKMSFGLMQNGATYTEKASLSSAGDFATDNDLTVGGTNVNLASGTTIGYNDNDTRANRLQIQSTTGNTTGLRISAPNATTSAVANLTAFSTNDYDNGEFIALQATGSTTAPFSIRTGKFTGGVLGASGEEINITDGGTIYASINPAGPTATTDLTTKSYVDGLIPTVVTYDFNATSTTGGANLNLVGSNATTDTVKLTDGGGITATYTSGTEVTLGSTATSANTAGAIVARDGSGDFSAGTVSLAGQLISTRANNTADGAGQIFLNGGSGNRIDWAAAGTGAPAFTTRSAGTKAVLYPSLGGSTTDYAVGIDAATMWSSVPENNDSFKFKWYGATTEVATLSGVGNLQIDGNLDVQGGTITESTGALSITTGASNGAITLDPNGTGNVVCTFSNGGNLTNDRNYVFGAIRNATTQTTNGDIWELNTSAAQSATNPYFRGVSLDNSADTTRGPATLMRSYSGGAGSGSAQRGRLIFEKARGTAASPTAIQSGDILGSIDVTGYTSTGWLNDTIPAVTGFFGFTASENYVSNTALGTNFSLSLAPTTTTISTGASLVQVMNLNPQSMAFRSDAYTFSQGKTGTTQNMALDVNGNLTVTGDVRVNGNDIQCSSGASAITLTSANTATTVRGDAINLQTAASVGIVGNNINYNRVYGQWQNLNTVTPAGSLTAYAFALPTQDFANISSVVSTSRITPGAAGMYKLQFSVQVQNDDTADEHVAYLWWRKNGTDVPGSMGRVGIFKAKGAVNGLTIAGWDNMISSANTTDYWELMYAVDDATHVDFPTFASTAFGPATSSLFVTLVPIGA